MALIPEGSAVRSPRTAVALAGIAALILTADQVTKGLVLSGRISGDAGWATVRLVRNTGSAGGIASGLPVLVTLAAAVITAVAVALLLRARGRATALFLAVILGGALGNLGDRLFRAGPRARRGRRLDPPRRARRLPQPRRRRHPAGRPRRGDRAAGHPREVPRPGARPRAGPQAVQLSGYAVAGWPSRMSS